MKRLRRYLFALIALACIGTWIARTGGTAEATGSAGFALAPTSGSYAVGATISVAVSETSQPADNANAVQVNLNFPAALLSWQSTNLTGPFTLCAQNAHGAGTVNLACAAPAAQTGTQAIATVSFTVLAAGSAPIALVTGSDIDNTSGQSVWNGTLPSSTYTLTSPAGSTPAPTPTPTPTPVPTATPKPSPTPSATPSPTSTAKPSASPLPTSSPTPSASAGASGPGSVSITVTDAKGRVEGAKVQLGGQTKETDFNGVVNFAGVPSGSVVVTITAPGDQPFNATITEAAGQNQLLSYHLAAASSALPVLLWIILGGLFLGALAGGGVWYWRSHHLPVPVTSSSSVSPSWPPPPPPAVPQPLDLPRPPVPPQPPGSPTQTP